MLNQPSQIRVVFEKVIQIIGKKRSIIPDYYVIEFHVKKGIEKETYTTHDGRVYIRLSASNRELMGAALIKYVTDKIT